MTQGAGPTTRALSALSNAHEQTPIPPEVRPEQSGQRTGTADRRLGAKQQQANAGKDGAGRAIIKDAFVSAPLDGRSLIKQKQPFFKQPERREDGQLHYRMGPDPKAQSIISTFFKKNQPEIGRNTDSQPGTSQGRAGNAYSADPHPQMVFQQTSPTEGYIYKLGSKSSPTPRVEVDAKTLDNLRTANKTVWEVRDDMGIKAGNQWLDIFTDGRSHYQTRRAIELAKEYGRTDPAGLAKSVVSAGAGTCALMTALTLHKLRQNGINEPLGTGLDSNGHVFAVIGDHREGKAIKADSWMQIPSAHVMSEKSIEGTKIKYTIPPHHQIPESTFSELKPVSKPEIDAHYQNWMKDTPDPETPMLQRIINYDMELRGNGTGNYMWNQVYGGESPSTQYAVKGNSAIQEMFNRVPVTYWQENIRAKQDSIDAYDRQNPGVMKAAGYKPTGSLGK